MTSITKVYWMLYDLKKYHLMAEYHDMKHKEILRECKNLIELDTLVQENMNLVKKQLGRKAFSLEEDFETYTDKYHHRKFFNEIEPTEALCELFKQFRKVTDTQPSKDRPYEISSYDLYPLGFWFDSIEEAESFLEENDVCPYTLFKYEDGQCEEIYSA